MFFIDQFFGFHDGTVTLVKFDDSPRPHCKISDAKLSKVHFSIVWEIQITFPVIGLSFGQLLGLDSKQNSCNSDNKGQVQVLKGAAHSSVDCSDAVSEILSDQLAVVTTKSFHLFSLSFGNSANTEKIANIDRFVAQIAPAPDTV